MNFTKEQQLAIETRGGKVIVRAAAGSGKTAVLSARIINYLIKGGKIEQLLVVTFTNLAANEMKERIKRNLNQVLLKNPHNQHLQEQLLLIEQASIMTMDAFYNKLIKEHFMSLNISPDYKIIDENEYLIIKKEEATSLILKLLEQEDKITTLLNNFSNYKQGTTIEELLIQFNEELNKKPNPEQWLNKLATFYKVDNFNSSLWAPLLYQELENDFKEYYHLYLEITKEIKEDDILSKKVYPFIINEKKPFLNLSEALLKKDLESLLEILKSFDLKKYPSLKGYADYPLSLKFKKIRNDFKILLKEYTELLSMSSTFKTDSNNLYFIIKELVMVTKLYRLKLEKIRETNNFYSFDEIPHLVLKLLIKDYNLNTGEIIKSKEAKALEEQYDEILIDEFQDTNLVQNIIFTCLSKKGTNLFIVGDVKQSIYGFRGARPDLFIKEKEETFKDNFPKLITLSKNFRSRKEVLDFTNYLFSKIMTKDYGKIDYNQEVFLNLGANYLEREDNNLELYLLTENESSKEEEELSNQEKEAIVITKRIKELFKSNYQVFDPTNNQYRPLLQKDIAILLRSPGQFGNILKETLINKGLNVYTSSTPLYFNNYEVKLIIALLKIIDDPYDEISLTAVMRSPLFGIEPSLLMEIRNFNNQNNLYDNLLLMTNNSLINTFLEALKRYRFKSQILKVNKLLNFIYNDTKIMALMGSMNEGKARIKNLLEMINHANKYNDKEKTSLHDFINYIDALIDNNYSFEGMNPPADKDCLLITTIHQAKGLEFPIVILPRLDQRFNFKDLNDELLFDDFYHFAFKLRNHENYTINSNLILELIKKEKKRKQLEEELRILYVALTRAKEKVIMSGLSKNLDQKIIDMNSLIGKENHLSLVYLKKVNCFLDWIIPVIIKHHKRGLELRERVNIYPQLSYETLNLIVKIKDLKDLSLEKEIVSLKKKKEIKKEELFQILDYDYPYSKTNYKTQMSVSELNVSSSYLRQPVFINDNQQLKVGTIYHKVLEHLPFITYNFETMKKAINELIIKGKITEKEIQLINLKKIFSFFEDPLYLKIKKEQTIKKEEPLFFSVKLKEIDNTSNQEDELVIDGIIDLLVETEKEIYIIDYKSDLVNNEEKLISKYKKQLDLYEKALKRKGPKKIFKYLYSFHLGKFIEVTSKN